MNDYVQFARNFLCCMKDWGIGPKFLYDAEVTALYYDFPEPLNKTTPLEFCISLLQFYPFIFLTKAGYSMCSQGVRTVYRVEELLKGRSASLSISEKNDEAAEHLITAKLQKDGRQALKDIIIGIQLLFIGISFFWLFANSWHVTETNWIGGIWGLIHALTVMEIALIVLLYYMIVDGMSKLNKSKAMTNLAASLRNKKSPSIDLSTYEFMSQWTPFWNQENGTAEDMKKETSQVVRTLDIYRGSNKKDGEKEEKIRQQTLEEIADRLSQEAHTTKMEGYREFVFFVVNTVAFYGYLLGIICFYFEESENEASWLRAMKFYDTHELADWKGNFAGDLMWTIEPIIVLSSPMVFSILAPKPVKEKSD